MSVSLQEMSVVSGTVDMAAALHQHGITADSLARQLSTERRAKETKFIKIRALPSSKQPERGDDSNEVETVTTKRGRGKAAAYRTVYEGGVMEDTVIAVDMVNWGVRQAARIDAQKLLGAYPSEKVDHKHEGTVFVHTGILRPMDDTPGQGIAVPGSSSRADTAVEVPK